MPTEPWAAFIVYRGGGAVDDGGVLPRRLASLRAVFLFLSSSSIQKLRFSQILLYFALNVEILSCRMKGFPSFLNLVCRVGSSSTFDVYVFVKISLLLPSLI